MKDIETKLINQIKQAMQEKGLKQVDYARDRGINRQSVNDYFSGRRGLLTDTGADLLEWLGLEIRLVPTGSTPTDSARGK